MKTNRNVRKLAWALCVPLLITACDRPSASRPPDQPRTAGQALDDKTLSSSVRSALDADSMKFPEVKVATYNGVVQLSGFVDTKDQKSRATEIAKALTGVQKVEDSITVKEERKP